MECLSAVQKRRPDEVISPGVVGSVGCVLSKTRLKQTDPEEPFRYAVEKDPQRLGSYVQNGSIKNYAGFGAGNTKADGHRKRTATGWRLQDLRVLPTSTMPDLLEIPYYNLHSHIATTNKANTRDLRYEMPGGYGMNSVSKMPRGLYPRIVQMYEGEEYIPKRTKLTEDYVRSSRDLTSKVKQID